MTIPFLQGTQLVHELVDALTPAFLLYLDSRPPPAGEEWCLYIAPYQGLILGCRTWDQIAGYCDGGPTVAQCHRQVLGLQAGAPRVVVVAIGDSGRHPPEAFLAVLDDGASQAAAAAAPAPSEVPN